MMSPFSTFQVRLCLLAVQLVLLCTPLSGMPFDHYENQVAYQTPQGRSQFDSSYKFGQPAEQPYDTNEVDQTVNSRQRRNNAANPEPGSNYDCDALLRALKARYYQMDGFGPMTGTFDKRFDSLDGSTLGQQKRANFDEIDNGGFGKFVKKNFDEIDRAGGFDSFVKRQDRIDAGGFDSFVKRQDRIDGSGFRSIAGFSKRAAPLFTAEIHKQAASSKTTQ